MEGVHSVAVIGAGAAGLIFAQVLLRDGITLTVYERQKEVGGIWNYQSGSSAMYESLRTNLPKEIMAYNPINPFKEQGESFISHREVQEYLVDFSHNHHLRDHIRFATTVTGVSRNHAGCGLKRWSVTSRTADSGDEHTDNFDSVIVCNGHFSVPYLPPSPPGLTEHFKGTTVHSVDYDSTKASLAGKRVLVVGSNSSGTDVARELLGTGAQVWVSVRSYNGPDTDAAALTLPAGDKEVVLPTFLSAISHVQSDGAIVFADGTVIPEIDAIVWCTGYLYDFPFLPTVENWQPSPTTPAAAVSESSSQPVVAVEQGKRVRPLYQQLFHVDDPTLVFAGLPFRVVPFPLFYFQAEYVAAVLQGRVVLPNLAHRYRWLARFEANLTDRRFYEDKYHYLGDGTDQWEYCRCLARVAGLPGTSGDAGCCKTRYHALTHIAVMEAIYDDNAAHRFREPGAPDTYRARHYAVDWPASTWTVTEGSN